MGKRRRNILQYLPRRTEHRIERTCFWTVELFCRLRRDKRGRPNTGNRGLGGSNIVTGIDIAGGIAGVCNGEPS